MRRAAAENIFDGSARASRRPCIERIDVTKSSDDGRSERDDDHRAIAREADDRSWGDLACSFQNISSPGGEAYTPRNLK
jgi:hypothetical protein